jgi:hypothetical protein
MIRNALYLWSSKALDGVDGGANGVLVPRDGTMRGGNSFFYYVAVIAASPKAGGKVKRLYKSILRLPLRCRWPRNLHR